VPPPSIPADRQNDPVGFLAQLESLTVTPDASARVVIDSANGIIVIGEGVRIGKVAVSYRGTRVTVGAGAATSAYSMTASGAAGAAQPEPFVIPDTTTVDDFVSTLKTAGLKADVIIGILQAVERAGALYGTLEIM
jgi:flagellar P-ring protein precursor FlgI